MRRSFREHHLLQLLEGYSQQKNPLDVFVHKYFRVNKACGSKDRKAISEILFSLVRWKLLIDNLCEQPYSWDKRYDAYKKLLEDDALDVSRLPMHVRYSTPKELFDLLVKGYGERKACKICLANNSPAPLTIRTNILKITRDSLLGRLKNKYDVTPCKKSPFGIVFHKRVNFYNMADFRNGFFDVQDEGSQLVGQSIRAKPGQLVLDYCAGAGGKTLTFAPKMHGRGQIFLHDIRAKALSKARSRLHRAGINNTRFIGPDNLSKLSKLRNNIDWVLVDAPCTGSGTMRRNPDMKWRFNLGMLEEVVEKQRDIFKSALQYMRPGGRIVYATCSIFNEENEEQVEYFIKTYGVKISGKIFKSLPAFNSMDGFFCVEFKL